MVLHLWTGALSRGSMRVIMARTDRGEPRRRRARRTTGRASSTAALTRASKDDRVDKDRRHSGGRDASRWGGGCAQMEASVASHDRASEGWNLLTPRRRSSLPLPLERSCH